MKKTLVHLFLALGFAAGSAQAASMNYSVNQTFQSGATFQGTVTIDNVKGPTAVTGTLYGYQFGTYGYVGGTASDAISWVWFVGQNYATASYFGNFLMDGTDSHNYSNWITFTYDYTNAPLLAFVGIGTAYSGNPDSNNVISTDLMTSGSISQTPLPAAFWMVGSALAGLIGFGRRKGP